MDNIKNPYETMFTRKREIIPSKEFIYVFNKYLSNIEEAQPSIYEVKRGITATIEKSEASVDNKPYTMYRYDYLEWLFVPKDENLFESDFDNIIKVSGYGNNKGFAVSIMNKEDGIIRINDYRYINLPAEKKVNSCEELESIVKGIYKYTEIYDEDNTMFSEFLKSGKSVERFLNTSLDFKEFKNKATVSSVAKIVNDKIGTTSIQTSSKDNKDKMVSCNTAIYNVKPLLESSEKSALNIFNKAQAMKKKRYLN